MSNDEPSDDRAVHTLPLDTDDGREVVLGQEAVGRSRVSGGGEFAGPHTPRDPGDVACEQEALDTDTDTDEANSQP